SLANAQLHAAAGAEGLDALRITADSISYSGTGAFDHPVELELTDTEVNLDTVDGARNLTFATAGQGAFTVDGHAVRFDGLPEGARWQAALATDATGALTSASFDFPGRVGVVREDGS